MIESPNSTTLTSEILAILSGAKYTVPAGHTFEAGNGNLIVPTVSFFDTTVFNAIDPSDSSFYLSLIEVLFLLQSLFVKTQEQGYPRPSRCSL